VRRGPKSKLSPNDQYLVVRWYWQGNYLKNIATALDISRSLLSQWIKNLRIHTKPGPHAKSNPTRRVKQRCHVVESRRRWRFRMEAEGRCTVCGALDGHKDWCKAGIKKVWEKI
jgi:transposase-like protein